MIDFFSYMGKRSRDFGIYISGSGSFNAPERDVTMVSIPGRDGDLTIDNGRFKNVSIVYPAFIHEYFYTLSSAAKAWLLSHTGYARLEDTYNPDIFRVGLFAGPIDFDMRFQNWGGECELVFNCKPQRFLKSGENIVEAASAVTVFNPTLFTALPLIRVYGTAAGTLIVGNHILQISKIDEYVDIDSDLQHASKGSQNCNDKISGNFPMLPPGETGVTFSGGIIKIEIKPRWWTI